MVSKVKGISLSIILGRIWISAEDQKCWAHSKLLGCCWKESEMQSCLSCPSQSCNAWWGWRGGTDYLWGMSGMRLPCNLLRERGKHLVAQHDCKDGSSPCLQRDLCWKTTTWPWGGPPFVQGDGSGSWKCFSFWSLLEDNTCYMCVCLPPFLQKYQSRTRFKAIFCK